MTRWRNRFAALGSVRGRPGGGGGEAGRGGLRGGRASNDKAALALMIVPLFHYR
jgi:hypothetical protein